MNDLLTIMMPREWFLIAFATAVYIVLFVVTVQNSRRRILSLQERLDRVRAMQELAEGDKTKTVYLPYEATNLLGSIGGIKDLFKTSE